MRAGQAGKRQGGATAIEFALVFPTFFLLFYGILAYGLIFLCHLGLQHAAEDGVRAALRAQTVTPGMTTQQQLDARVAYAKAVAAAQASWMNGWQVPAISVNVCLSDVICDAVAASSVYPDCSTETGCQIVMSITYDYASKPIIPNLLGFGLVTPDVLQGRARILIDGRALSA